MSAKRCGSLAVFGVQGTGVVVDDDGRKPIAIIDNGRWKQTCNSDQEHSFRERYSPTPKGVKALEVRIKEILEQWRR